MSKAKSLVFLGKSARLRGPKNSLMFEAKRFFPFYIPVVQGVLKESICNQVGYIDLSYVPDGPVLQQFVIMNQIGKPLMAGHIGFNVEKSESLSIG